MPARHRSPSSSNRVLNGAMASPTADGEREEEMLGLVTNDDNEEQEETDNAIILVKGKEIATTTDSPEKLVERSCKSSLSQRTNRGESEYSLEAGFSFNIKTLAIIVLVLLVASHVLLFRQCFVALLEEAQHASNPTVQRYRVNTNRTSLTIHKRPKDSGSSGGTGEVHPGDIVEVYHHRHYDSQDCYRIIQPLLGYVRKVSPNTGKPYLVPLDNEESVVSRTTPSICPIINQGWWPVNEKSLRSFLYAPTPLVVAQQFWNAMQVLALYLVICISYCLSTTAIPETMHDGYNNETSWWNKTRCVQWVTRSVSVAMVAILPFSVYVVSPGAHIFAILTLLATLVAFFVTKRRRHSILSLSLGEQPPCDNTTGDTSRSSPTWTIGWEETLAFFCNLGSSLYNFAGHTGVWPHWKWQFYKLDAFFGLKDWGDVTVDEDYTILGLFSSARMPLFVARGTGGSTFGGQVFLGVWCVQPFLYVSYFTCMYVLSRKSPGVYIQRALCLFGICHFLFFTDVVAYRYGRGYHNPHEALFHWTEKWSWRIAVLMPIYQNCTNGHWEHGNKRFPIVGKLFHWAMMIWGIWFLIFQVINSDVFLTYQFIRGLHKENLLEKLGLDDTPILREWDYPYMRSVRNMWVVYGLLSLSALSRYGFTLFGIHLKRAKNVTTKEERMSSKDGEEMGGAQLGLLEDNELELTRSKV